MHYAQYSYAGILHAPVDIFKEDAPLNIDALTSSVLDSEPVLHSVIQKSLHAEALTKAPEPVPIRAVWSSIHVCCALI